MFFQGSLQEGIATALSQDKLVVSFVTDGETESNQWETEFLADEALKGPLSTQAVVLKLKAGSPEAKYLADVFPIPKTPTIVIIRNGELKEYLTSGVSKKDFLNRTAKALGTASQQQPPAPAPAPSTSTAVPANAQPSPAITSLLAERALRLAAQKEAQRKLEAEQRRLNKGKDKASTSKPLDPTQAKYADDLKRRQTQAREDRARVLQAIEDDKAARRAKVSEREAERLVAAGVPVSVMPEEKGEVGTAGDVSCKLQIRLFDGSTVRGRWEATDTLGREVRGWLDGQEGMKRVGSGYSFKVILTPAPSRGIDVGEEGRTLRELGLAPSATLVLVPAAGGTRAYPGTVGGNPVTRMVMMVVGVVTGLWALVVNFFASLFGGGAAPAAVGGRGGGDTGATSGMDQGRKQGLRHLRPEGERKDGQQFYNGNSTNFEPRKDDDDEQQ